MASAMVSTMVIGPGRVNLHLLLGMGAGVARFRLMHAALQPQRRRHHRHHGLIAVGADAHLDLVGEIDAVDEFEEAVHEMLARLSPSQTMSIPASSCSFTASSVASSLACARSAPASRHCGQSLSGSASQEGFGRLPAMRGGKDHVGILAHDPESGNRVSEKACRRARPEGTCAGKMRGEHIG